MAVVAHALITLAELKAGLEITGATEDAKLETILNAMADRVRDDLGRQPVSTTYTDIRVDGSGQCALYDTEWPITTLTSVYVDAVLQTLWLPGDAVEPDTKDVALFASATPPWTRRFLHRWSGWPRGRGNVKLTYIAGYGIASYPIPDALKEATLMLCGSTYRTRTFNQYDTQSQSLNGQSVTFAPDLNVRRYWDCLRPYRRPAV